MEAPILFRPLYLLIHSRRHQKCSRPESRTLAAAEGRRAELLQSEKVGSESGGRSRESIT